MLENKDCLEFLKTLEDNSVDLIINDPPYFEIVKNSWDNQWSSEDEYLEWCKEWTAECVRVLKPNRMMCVWGTTKTDTFLRYKLDVLNSEKELEYRNWVIWSYDWGGRPRNNFSRKHEDLLIYSKGKKWLFNAEDILEERAVKTNMALQRKINLLKKKLQGDTFSEKDERSWKTYSFDKLDQGEYKPKLEELKNKNARFEKGKIPTDVWQKNNHTTSKEYANWHPTQKPLALLERLIKAYTNEGDVVVDIFSGSGSTMIATKNCNRIFRGCELDKEYYDKSLKRFEELT